MVRLLALPQRLESDVAFGESCHRCYWICYIVEHELRNCVHYGTELLDPLQERLSLPLSDRQEPAFFFFLSEIALRRIYVNGGPIGLSGAGRAGRVVYAPMVADELTTQLEQWHKHLHHSVKFDLGAEPLLDQQKAFLRGQFYAALFQASHQVRRLYTIDS